MSLKDDCDCGHDRSAHFYDPVTKTHENCLGMRCDCERFTPPGEDKPPPPRPQHHPSWCKCYYCKQHPEPDSDHDLIDEDPPDTDPNLTSIGPRLWPWKFP